MLYATYALRTLCPPLGETAATLTAYCPDNSPEIDPKRARAAVIVCPGGGYVMTSDREAEPIALEFVSKDLNVFVLRYSCAPARYPQALLELAASAAFVRREAARFQTDPEKLAVCGFSAGGHLACSLGVSWNEPFLSDKLGISNTMFCPNAMILGYPVVTPEYSDCAQSFPNLLGPGATKEQNEAQSLDRKVGPHTPPAFIWHTFDDSAVPVQNSFSLAQALRKNGVPFDLHIFSHGPHGLSLCDSRTGTGDWLNPDCAVWPQLCENWLKHLFSLNL